MTAASFGKIPTIRDRLLISLFTRSSGFVNQTFGQWLRGNAVKASTSALASSINGPILGKVRLSWSRTVSQVAATVAGSGGWAKMVRNTAATMSLWDFGTRASRFRMKCTRQRWWPTFWKTHRRAETSPACGSEMTSRTPVSPTFLQRPQERPPRHLVLGVADLHTQDFTAAVGGDAGRDHDGRRGDLATGGAADMEIGGVEEHVREADVVQRPGAERLDLLVQPGADPAHL